MYYGEDDVIDIPAAAVDDQFREITAGLIRVDSGRGQDRTLRPLSAFWPPVFAGEQDVGLPKG